MTIDERQRELVALFSDASDWEERYGKLIDLGRALGELPEALRQERYRVRGCQSQVWLHAALDADQRHVIFRADSDALIVKGLIALLLRVYSDATPAEILASPPRFIDELGLARHLSPTRSNGLRAMVEQMVYYAKAFETLRLARGQAAPSTGG
ncbi:MAG: SufE family protein [Proteobacteria bacterium]|nr:SufE family protein [Pseudomonadota bacterium]